MPRYLSGIKISKGAVWLTGNNNPATGWHVGLLSIDNLARVLCEIELDPESRVYNAKFNFGMIDCEECRMRYSHMLERAIRDSVGEGWEQALQMILDDQKKYPEEP